MSEKVKPSYKQTGSGKPWKYLLLPHSEVLPNMSLAYFAAKREFKESL